MSTMTVWKFQSADGAEAAMETLEQLQKEELINVLDGAVVTWPTGKTKSKIRQLHGLTVGGALSPATAPRAVLPLPVLCKSVLEPIAVFVLPVRLSLRAASPKAVFRFPVRLLMAASVPIAVFSIPWVLLKSALAPTAVLLSPVSLKTRASKPMAVLAPPVVLSFIAASPIAVLKLPVVSLKSA